MHRTRKRAGDFNRHTDYYLKSGKVQGTTPQRGAG